ncbi:hypothetical protein D3C72_1564580 [compost metagenome]
MNVSELDDLSIYRHVDKLHDTLVLIARCLLKNDRIRGNDRIAAQTPKTFAVDGVFKTNLQPANDCLLVWVAKIIIEELYLIARIDLRQEDNLLEEDNI